LKSDQLAINLARHGDELTLELLFKKVNEMIADHGEFFLLVPAYREQETVSIAEKNGMYLQKKARVKQSLYHEAFRIMYAFSKNKDSEIENQEIRKVCIGVVEITLNAIIKRIDTELLEMEKEQIMDTWNNAINAVEKDKWESFEQYYKETFKSK
jgi:hypothetical protein